MTTLQDHVDKTIGHEGGYVNNPDDSGGETIWGITIDTARKYGYHGPMRTMPRTEAVRIYIEKFLIEPKIDKINSINTRVCFEVYDTGVNTGPSQAVEFLQQSLNALNRRGQDYADMIVDGKLGSKTLAALQTFLRLRGQAGEVVLLKMLNVLQGAFYISLAERREKDETFVFGWFANRIDIPGRV